MDEWMNEHIAPGSSRYGITPLWGSCLPNHMSHPDDKGIVAVLWASGLSILKGSCLDMFNSICSTVSPGREMNTVSWT